MNRVAAVLHPTSMVVVEGGFTHNLLQPPPPSKHHKATLERGGLSLSFSPSDALSTVLTQDIKHEAAASTHTRGTGHNIGAGAETQHDKHTQHHMRVP